MATNPVKQAEQIIEDAVLQFLQPTRGGAGVGPKAISEGVGLFREKVVSINDAYAHGAINALVKKGLIERADQPNGEGAARALLACEAMAHRHPHRLPGAGGAELPAPTGGDADGHGGGFSGRRGAAP